MLIFFLTRRFLNLNFLDLLILPMATFICVIVQDQKNLHFLWYMMLVISVSVVLANISKNLEKAVGLDYKRK